VPYLESLDAMIALRAEGKIGHIALSNVTLAQLEQAMQRTPIAGVQNLYNVVLGERAARAHPAHGGTGSGDYGRPARGHLTPSHRSCRACASEL
jgi:aryl-alcohol dehydrogenase-like predicted oxidoreductase